MINFPLFRRNNAIQPPYTGQKLAFKGHTGIEEYGKNGISKLIHQTSFFRDFQTKKFAVDYIHKNFKDKTNIKIIVGACSTGEEALTLSMMLSNMTKKVDILGIDLGEKAINQANRKKFLLQKADVDNPVMLGILDKYDDWYLGFDTTGYPLLPHEKAQKRLFKDFFIPSKTYQYQENLMEHKGSVESRYIRNYESKIFKLKKNKGKNCKFIVGDIMDLKNLTNGEKSDVIFFSNALYHLTALPDRKQKSNAEAVIKKLAKVLRANLNKNGLVCFGEKEKAQGVNTTLLEKIMEENGFETVKILKQNDTMLPDAVFAKDEKNYTKNVFRKIR